jgi:hypothetical protein
MAYSAGGTSILAGLQLAINEINSYSKHNLTVVGEYRSYSMSAVERVYDVKGDAFLLNLAKRKVKKSCHNERVNLVCEFGRNTQR